MSFDAWSDAIREKFIAHYSKHYEISYEVELGGELVPLMFTMRSREPKTMLGFSMKNAGLGPEAGETLFLLFEREFGADMPERMAALARAAEAEFIRPDSDHGFTLISVVAVCEGVSPDVAKALKKLKHAREYPKGGGWMMTRAAAVCHDGAVFCNRDGKALGELLKRDVL